MVDLRLTENFQKSFNKIKDNHSKEKIIAQVNKLKEAPETGKPMRYKRKGTRELYIKPYRLSYAYEKELITLLDIYHKDQQ